MKTKQIQKGWKEIQLEKLFELKYGSSLPESKRIEGNIEVYGSNGLIGFHNKGITKGQTIIVGRKGSIGKINLSNSSCFPIDTTYYIDETKIHCNLKWLFYILKKLNLESLNRSAAVPGLNRKDVYSKKIPLPPLQTQKAIVSILEKAEQLKEKRKKAIEFLDEYLKSVFNEMLLNKGFEKVELGDKKIFDTQSGGTPSKTKKEYWENGTIPWIGSTACKDLPINKSKYFITEKGLKNSAVKLFPKNTILVALVGATIGKTGILNFECATNQNIAGIIIKDNSKVNHLYLFYSLQQKYNEFLSLSQKSFKMANLSFVHSLKIFLPPIELQQKFASIVENIEKLKEKQKQSLKEIETLFNSLIQKSFRGKLVK